jgi:hypothetical protein
VEKTMLKHIMAKSMTSGAVIDPVTGDFKPSIPIIKITPEI